jgi:5'-nucleotidase
MRGAILVKILETGKGNAGNGGFLQYSANLAADGGVWKLGGLPIDPAKTYRVALTDFLLTGKETNMDFLEPGNKDIAKVYEPQTALTNPQSDIRLAIIRYLEQGGK